MRFNWGTGILLFFTVFLALAFTFIVFSFKQNNDLVTDDYYEKGADYSTQIAINKRSFLYADSIRVKTGNGHVQILLSESILSQADSLNAYFYYAASKENDVTTNFVSLGDTLLLNKSAFAHGRYIAKIHWTMQNEKYYLEKTVFID